MDESAFGELDELALPELSDAVWMRLLANALDPDAPAASFDLIPVDLPTDTAPHDDAIWDSWTADHQWDSADDSDSDSDTADSDSDSGTAHLSADSLADTDASFHGGSETENSPSDWSTSNDDANWQSPHAASPDDQY
jgi:hypothetical protein